MFCTASFIRFKIFVCIVFFLLLTIIILIAKWNPHFNIPFNVCLIYILYNCSCFIYISVLTNKTDRHDITEILLKVALNTIALIPYFSTSLMDSSYRNCTFIKRITFTCTRYIYSNKCFVSKYEHIQHILFILKVI